MTDESTPDDRPTVEDWLAVGNGIRRSMNRIGGRLGIPPVPMLDHADRPPTDEELAEYDELVPGAAEKLRRSAVGVMNRRKQRERMSRSPLFRLGRWVADVMYGVAQWIEPTDARRSGCRGDGER